jgi:hypothetical protein
MKDIKVRYSYDNWTTFKETSAKYNFNENYTMNLGDSLGFPGLK